jgi:hypothetical protein
VRRKARGVFGVLLVVGIAFGFAAPATARTSGNETLDVVIVVRDVSGTRTVLGSVVIARGAFSGVGRIVEVENQPGDPDNVLRDDLVFRDGSMHLISTTLDFAVSVDPRSCIVSVTVQQSGRVVGGTGRFAAASGSFTGTLSGRGLAARNSDGSCSQEQALLFEVDKISETGTLSF